MAINLAETNDIPKLVEFQRLMAKETENVDLDLELLTKGIERVINDPHKGCYFKLSKEEKVIGCFLTVTEWSDWRNRDVLWLHSVFIKEDYRGQGLFKEMLAWLEAYAKEQGMAGIRLYVDKTNQAAIKVYEKSGLSNDHYQLFEKML
jgi:GNAT superfamily N-acetyltransferase